ncbi:MAG: hypothetical protein HRT52_23985 [Colwellia sp.]|nr:hypothetical protein [Colwellia sp.]
MDVKKRVCSGRTVFRGHMDVKKRVCSGQSVNFLVPDKSVVPASVQAMSWCHGRS